MNKEKIIIALDVSSVAEAREIVKNLRGEVGAFKIGLQLLTAEGTAFVREMVESEIKIFLDVKFHDIPNTVAKAAIEAARLGVWMFNIHACGGSEMMRRSAEDVRRVCARENLTAPKIIGVTVLTSSNNETLREIGIESEAESQVLKLARLAADCGLDGVVASPHEIKAIRRMVASRDFLIVTPGIRNAQTENSENKFADDQKRVMTAAEAIDAGADFLVIGRPILQSANMVSAAREISAGIRKGN